MSRSCALVLWEVPTGQSRRAGTAGGSMNISTPSNSAWMCREHRHYATFVKGANGSERGEGSSRGLFWKK